MTHAIGAAASSSLLMQLANPAVRALALAAGAGLGLAAFRVKASSARLLTWTAVLYAAVAMPLLAWMLPPLPVPMPAMFQSDASTLQDESPQLHAAAPVSAVKIEYPRQHVTNRTSSIATNSQSASVPPLSELQSAARSSSSPSTPIQRSSIPWSALATELYFVVALLLLTRFVVGLILARRLMRASQEVHEPRLAQRLATRAYASGLASVARVAESDLISVPVTVGAFRSTILLPATWREWDDAKLDAVVAHEMSHVARRDALTQRLSLLHRAIFWFSPLAWWLDRHLTDLAEQASDEAALSCGADRNEYARTLLGFFEALQAAPGRVWWQGVSMAKAGQAEQRLERILTWRGAVTMSLKKSEQLKKSFAVAIIALGIPVIYLAASVHPANAQQSGQSAAPAAPSGAATAPSAEPVVAPAEESTDVVEEVTDQADAPEPALAPVAPELPAAPVGGVYSVGPVTAGPIAPMAPVGPVAAIAPVAPWPGQSHKHVYSYAYGYDDEQRFVIVTGNSDSLTMSGSGEDARHVEKLRKQIQGDFIWFQRDERSYVIRDQATVDRAKKLWAPQEELGKKQAELGKQQEVLGKQQEALGKRMQEIHVQVPDMSAQLDKLKAELKQLSSGATVEQVGRIQSEIGELQSRIGEIQSHAGDQQGKLGEEMGALGEKQGKLGEQQGELAREATQKMKELLDEAIKNGTAKPEAEGGGTASL